MGVVTIPLVRGRDNKLYPVGHRRSAEDNARAAGTCHALRHQGLNFREIVRRLPEFGLRVSFGSVWTLWHTTECDYCAEVPPEPPAPPDPRNKPQAFAWR